MGLPADFQALLDYDEMVSKSVPNFGHALRTKDLSYRAMTTRRRDTFPRRDRDGRFEGRDRKEDSKDSKEGRNRSDRGFAGKDGTRDREKDRRRNEGRRQNGRKNDDTKEDPPPQLPKDKWRKDDKGRIMKRKCRFCSRWHMDYDCPSRPSSYSLTATVDNQWHSSSDDDEDASDPRDGDDDSSSVDSDEGVPGQRWKSTRDITMTYHNVYSNTTPMEDVPDLKIPRASHYRVEE
jgi:hypothetical protein